MTSLKKKQKEPQYILSVQNNQMLNYNVYYFSRLQSVLYGLLFFLCGAAVGFVFYGNLFMKDGEPTMLTWISNAVICVGGGIGAAWMFLPIRQEQMAENRRGVLRLQFREMLSALSTAYASGENTTSSFESAYGNMSAQYGSESYIARELAEIVTGMRNNHPVDQLLLDFGQRSGLEDVEDFANLFQVCYSKGGNLKYVVRNAYDMIGDKLAINDEIQTKITSNQMQQNIMSVVPIFMIAFLRFSSSSFAESFASPKGVVAMTVAAGLFLFSYRLGKKIIDIKG